MHILKFRNIFDTVLSMQSQESKDFAISALMYLTNNAEEIVLITLAKSGSIVEKLMLELTQSFLESKTIRLALRVICNFTVSSSR